MNTYKYMRKARPLRRGQQGRGIWRWPVCSASPACQGAVRRGRGRSRCRRPRSASTSRTSPPIAPAVPRAAMARRLRVPPHRAAKHAPRYRERALVHPPTHPPTRVRRALGFDGKRLTDIRVPLWHQTAGVRSVASHKTTTRQASQITNGLFAGRLVAQFLHRPPPPTWDVWRRGHAKPELRAPCGPTWACLWSCCAHLALPLGNAGTKSTQVSFGPRCRLVAWRNTCRKKVHKKQQNKALAVHNDLNYPQRLCRRL